MKTHTGKAATEAYTPETGHMAVLYTHKFKPEHYAQGVELIFKEVPDAQAAHHAKTKQKRRHNLLLTRPYDHEVINISFFDVDQHLELQEWHKSPHRQAIVRKMADWLAKPVDVQVYDVLGVTGVSE